MIASEIHESESGKGEELVVLVHGFGSKKFWMWFLKRRLEQFGYSTYNWGYSSFFGSLDGRARRLCELLEEIDSSGKMIHLVAHSMGGIIVRLALSHYRVRNLGRVVLLAPPNQGTPVARLIAPILRPLCPVVAEVSSKPDSFVHQMNGAEGIAMGIIGGRFDATVPLSRTFLEGQTDHVCLPATHTSLLVQPSAARLVHAFLSTGSFYPATTLS